MGRVVSRKGGLTVSFHLNKMLTFDEVTLRFWGGVRYSDVKVAVVVAVLFLDSVSFQMEEPLQKLSDNFIGNCGLDLLAGLKNNILSGHDRGEEVDHVSCNGP